ncbi:daunorubicin resistance protein DrrA family ABC transporter ATP-binding protein [Paractinoplanes ferrugineus]|uniref:Daunorubicin resistance protein DrrA family ABC transporter ATP-binding protein n=1 Tax=Paractinoplanes ferrugineus TaxID=113564 RepID=A0A919IZH0_9ACTN|nr:ATP-binding cassette domain-containing protein [Actinoplanes ferrugineus]GIE09594.1 daunorubicin resistance protein DrrA family ABC transporter ATP-binding protein [Actinoplanes ferrugineus]
MRGPAIEATGLTRRFRDTTALDHVDLSVPAGTVHGLLGPNGAGKTTAVRILSTLLRPDAGTARVAGHDVVREADRVRARIGLVGQRAAVDEELSGRQNLEMFGRLHHLGGPAARRRAAALLDRFDLATAADKPASTYSGGMRRRLDLAAGLLIGPAVLFLDEPTIGLDPRGRNEVWREIRALVADGTTVLLTTQYLEEADQLADGLTVLDHGRVIAAGTPDELKGADHLDVVVRAAEQVAKAAELLARIGTGEPRIDPDQRRVSVAIADRVAALTSAARELTDVEDISLRRPTLDEAFLQLTGKGR